MESKKNLLSLIDLSIITIRDIIDKREKEDHIDRYQMMISILNQLKGDILNEKIEKDNNGIVAARMLTHNDSVELKNVVMEINKLYCKMCESIIYE